MRWDKFLVVWIAIALVYGFQSYLFYSMQGFSCNFGGTLIDQLPNFLLWGFYTPLIFWLGRKFPVQGKWRNLLKVHVPVALAIATLHSLLISFVRWKFYVDLIELSFPEYLSGFFQQWFFFQLILYAAVLLVFHLVQKDKAFHEKQNEALKLGKLLADTRLDVLKAQMQPHFLFNTLNTVSMLIRAGESRKANTVLSKLGTLLRQVLDHSDTQWTTVEQEIEWLQKYLEIEQERFSDRFTFQVEVDKSVAQEWLPNQLLQPLVENAVKHGLKNKDHDARLFIKAFRQNGHNVINIFDNGQGFETYSTTSGLGLRNVKERLAIMYHKKGELRIESAPGEGTTVEIRFPRMYA